MQKFDKSAAWDDTKRLLGAHVGLVWAVAGVFIFLPQLLLDIVAGQMQVSAPATGPSLEELTNWIQSNFIYILIMGVCALAGTIAIMRLWLARASISVGDALKIGFSLVPTLFITQLITGFASGVGVFLFIIPGLYLYARFIAVGPMAADLKIMNPIQLITGSWALTKGRGFSILLYILLVIIAAVIVYILVASVAAMVFSFIPGIGLTLLKVVNAALTTIFNIFIIAVTTSIYRQLMAIGGEALFKS